MPGGPQCRSAGAKPRASLGRQNAQMLTVTQPGYMGTAPGSRSSCLWPTLDGENYLLARLN